MVNWVSASVEIDNSRKIFAIKVRTVCINKVCIKKYEHSEIRNICPEILKLEYQLKLEWDIHHNF